jgi:hypothetical protein
MPDAPCHPFGNACHIPEIASHCIALVTGLLQRDATRCNVRSRISTNYWAKALKHAGNACPFEFWAQPVARSIAPEGPDMKVGVHCSNSCKLGATWNDVGLLAQQGMIDEGKRHR